MEKTPLLLSAADIAKDRFDKYLKEKLKNLPDDCIWEFYTYLFEQAQNKKVNFNYKKCIHRLISRMKKLPILI